jgi:hypothetical protein
MSVLSSFAANLASLPGILASLDPVAQALVLCFILLVLAAIPATARFAVYAGLAILFLQIIH